MTKSRKSGRPATADITPPQRRTLETVRQFIADNGIPPTLQELGTLLKISSASVHEQIGQLIRKGFLRREPRKARNLTVVHVPTDQVADLIEIPVLGTVTAGMPVLAEENVIGQVMIDASLMRGANCFALRVSGDSMVRANIHDGDFVVVRQQAMAENGEVVVAMKDGEVTVKRLSFANGQVELRPENSRYRPIPIGLDDDFRILGKVVAVTKPLER